MKKIERVTSEGAVERGESAENPGGERTVRGESGPDHTDSEAWMRVLTAITINLHLERGRLRALGSAPDCSSDIKSHDKLFRRVSDSVCV